MRLPSRIADVFMTGRTPAGMDTPDRRGFLATLGAAGTTATLAGCSDDSNGGGDPGATATADPTPTSPPESQFVTDDGFVDYPGMVDGAATVDPDGTAYTIEYTDPSRGFRLESGFEGESDPSELRVTRDMTVDTRAGFVAPIYDEAAGEFVYQVFVNRAYLEYGEWHFVTVDENDELTEQGEAPFERAQGEVFAAGVTPGDIRLLFVVDASAEDLRKSGGNNLTGIVLQVSAPTTPTPTDG